MRQLVPERDFNDLAALTGKEILKIFGLSTKTMAGKRI